ncbi:MAG TPA: GH3 auxin-responsive promoter family protein [Phycisphaerae bacterium]|nr:GH3 auxin-responsive promoter family protein [Phycisphaerae bacterium]
MPSRSILDSVLAKIGALHAASITRRFSRAVANATRVQSDLLAELLAAGEGSDFGRDHGLASIRDYREFARQVPIRSYADLEPYIEKVRNGHVGALFSPQTRILMFALTSGTTARPKYIPITPRVLADCRAGWNIWGLKALLDHPGTMLRHILQVTSPMNDHSSPSGLPCGAITGLLAATQKRLVRRYYTSPPCVANITDSVAKYYTIMRLAIPRDVAWAVTANPATLLLLAKTGDEHREQLIRDIHDGTLSASMAVDGGIRAALHSRLEPDPDCARRLETIVAKHGALYPKHYWRLGYVAHWTGGTMGLYRDQFPRYFGDVPARDIGLIASEGRMSIPVDDHTPAGILAVTSQFFEFIPASEYGGSNPTVVRSHELTIDEEYFIVLTNASGLYRYDLGDRIRVVRRVGEAPLIEFLSRDAHSSSMAGEKLTEDQVVAAMEAASPATGKIVDFVLAPRWADPPYYRLYVESASVRAEAALARRVDEALSKINLEYGSKRATLRLGEVETVGLPAGALAQRDMELRRARSGTSEQFKHQYLLSRPELDGDLAQLAVDRAAVGAVHQSPGRLNSGSAT